MADRLKACGAPKAVTIAEKDQLVRELVLANLAGLFVANSSGGSGSHTTAIQTLLDTVSTAVMSQEMIDNRLQSSVERVLGISRSQQCRALHLKRLARESANSTLQLTLPKASKKYGRLAPIDLEPFFDWFHNDCELVEIDKSQKMAFEGRYGYKIAGKIRRINCQRRMARGTRLELVNCLKTSGWYMNHTSSLGRTISTGKLMSCICKCIKARDIKECACPLCTEMVLLLKAWREQRLGWRKDKTCTCAGCSDSKKLKMYLEASKSVSSFLGVVTCARKPYPHLKLPHLPREVPCFYPLACCKKSTTHPRHVTECHKCSWENVLYSCDLERTQDHAHYMEWAPVVSSNFDTAAPQQQNTGKASKVAQRAVLMQVTCTRDELLQKIVDKHRLFKYHHWINEMTTHQEKLDVATFDGETAIIVKTDFAAAAMLQASYTATCEWPTTAQQCVALVLHSPQPLVQHGAPRAVKCDHWRAWSSTKPGEQFHQMLMRDIAAYYKMQVSAF